MNKTIKHFHGFPGDDEHQETKYLLFPDDPWKRRWDVISAMYSESYYLYIIFFSGLLYAVIIMPVQLAFANEALTWEVLDLVLDAIFLGDIIVTFFSAYLDSNYRLVTDRKVNQSFIENIIIEFC
jgi:hypothetical protein